MQALAIYFTYGLQCYMPIRILNYGYAIPAIEEGTCKGTPFLWDLIIRFGITIVTCKQQFFFKPFSYIVPLSRYFQDKLGQARSTAADWISLSPFIPEQPTSGIDQSIRLQSALDSDITKVQESTFAEFDIDAQFCQSLVWPASLRNYYVTNRVVCFNLL